MAIGEVLSALLVMKGDVSDLRAKLRTVAADEKDMVKAQIASAEARNKSIEKNAEMLGKLSAGIAVVTKVIAVGAESFKAYEEHSRLSAASSKYNIDALRKSSAGLKTDLDLMRLAQRAAGAQHSISQDQLENATKAMRAFEAAGFDGAKVQELVGQAMLKGSIEPLKELGISLDAAKGKTAQAAQLMEVLGQKSREAGSGVNSQTDEFKRAGVEYQNAMNKLRVAIGEIVIALAPLISALAKVVALVADVVNQVSVGTARNSPIFSISGAAGGQFGYGYGDGINNQFSGAGRVQKQLGALDNVRGSQADAILAYTNSLALGGLKPPKPKKRGGSGKSKSPVGYVELENTGEVVPIWGASGDLGRTLGASSGPNATQLRIAGDAGGIGGMDLSGLQAGMAGLAEQFQDVGLQHQANQSFLASMFGELEEFNAYSTAFDLLAGSAQAGFDAWVSGSASAGAAMKKFFKDAIAGLASQMFVEALKHGAYAIGSLAMHDPVGAATHAKAAAAFAAGAIVAGGLAKTMGGGASAGASGGAGRAPSVGGGGSASGGGPVVNNYYVGDYLSPDNPRQRRPELNRAVRMANRESRDSEIVRYS